MHLRHSQSSRVSLPVGVTPALAAQDPSVPVPYTIKDHKIGGRSIRVRVDASPHFPLTLLKSSVSLQVSDKNGSVEWTSACKYVLTNLKWLVAWSIRNDGT